MRYTVFWALSIALIFAAGCAGGSNPSPPLLGSADKPNAVAKSSPALLYVCTAISAWQVSIFKQRGSDQPLVGTITQGIDGALGVFVDKQRNLYAGNAFNGTVTVYPPGNTSPSETLTGAGAPLSVVVASDGTVYVANVGNVNSPSNSTLLEYRKGRTLPTKTIASFGNKTTPRSLALDSSDNLYAAVDRAHAGSTDGEVLEFMHGSSTKKNLGIVVGHVGELTIDKSNDLILVDEDANSVDVFPPGSTAPSREYTGFPACCIYGVALNRSNTKLWVTDGFWGHIFGLTYPAGQFVDTISPGLGWTLGVATSPEGSE